MHWQFGLSAHLFVPWCHFLLILFVKTRLRIVVNAPRTRVCMR